MLSGYLLQIWDVLSNKEVVDIVASATHSYAARALVESAVRAWRYKYPTSKVDDCAVVCLFFDSNNISTASAIKSEEKVTAIEQSFSTEKGMESHEEALDENIEDDLLDADPGKDWSALEGVSRVNTLLTLPRFVPGKEDIEAAGGAKSRK